MIKDILYDKINDNDVVSLIIDIKNNIENYELKCKKYNRLKLRYILNNYFSKIRHKINILDIYKENNDNYTRLYKIYLYVTLNQEISLSDINNLFKECDVNLFLFHYKNRDFNGFN